MTEKGRAVRRLVGEALVWLAIVGGLWVYSDRFDVELSNYAWSPVGWPRAILLLTAAVAVLFLWAGIRRLRAGAPLPEAPEADDVAGFSDPRTALRIAATFVLPLAYLWLMPRMGFFVTTPLFLAGYMYLFGQRKLRHLIGTTAAIYAGVLLAFSKWLYVPLPTGNWPVFYNVSNALLDLIGAG